MEFESDISLSEEYKTFRSNVCHRKVCIDDDHSKIWKVYDAGPKDVKCPLIFLPPVTGTADCYFYQLLTLTAKGIRVLLVDSPSYFNINEWCQGFRNLLNYFELNVVHIFGASLGGYLAQKFCEYTSNCPRVASLILCNSYTDTKIFNYIQTSPMFRVLPLPVLRKYVLQSIPKKKVDSRIADAIDFMIERLNMLTQAELASRLTLTCHNDYIQPQKIKASVMIMDVFDESALLQNVKDEMYKCYPNARMAHLKTGGNYPYLSRSDEVCMYIQVHLREFSETKHSPFRNE